VPLAHLRRSTSCLPGLASRNYHAPAAEISPSRPLYALPAMAESLKSIQDELNNIPLVDEDAQEVADDDTRTRPADRLPEPSETKGPERQDAAVHAWFPHEDGVESMPSSLANGSDTPPADSLDDDLSSDDAEEKERLIQQVLELQNTLDDLSQRVDSVKEENLKLKSENQVLGQYIENLMAASSVFQSTSTNPAGQKKGKK